RLATALQTLSPPEIQVLQWLAASEQPLHVMLLKDLMGLPAPQLHSVLQNLLQLGLIIYAAPARLSHASDELAFSLRTLYDSNLIASLHAYLAQRLETCLRDSSSSPLRPRVEEQYA